VVSSNDTDQDTEQLRKYLQLIDDYKHVFSSDAGQRVLRDLEDFSGLLSDGFDPDTSVTAYNAGRRSVGIYLLRMLEMSRSDIQDMVRKQTSGD